MRKLLLVFLFLQVYSFLLFAQSSVVENDSYITSHNQDRYYMSPVFYFNSKLLNSSLYDFVSIASSGGNCGMSNFLFNTKWIVRGENGKGDWLDVHLHEGISVDDSFWSPMIDTRTWWDRHPNNDVQSWGDLDKTYMSLNRGKLGIGTTSPRGALDVNGSVYAKEIIVTEEDWADFVFDDSYKLPTLKDVETHIKVNKHLMDIPRASEISEKGVNVAEMQVKLLQKIEELTLYIIEQQKRIEVLEKQQQK